MGEINYIPGSMRGLVSLPLAARSLGQIVHEWREGLPRVNSHKSPDGCFTYSDRERTSAMKVKICEGGT